MSDKTDLKTALGVGAVIIGACILLRAIPLLILGGVVYLLYLATKRDNSSTKENQEECKPGKQMK